MFGRGKFDLYKRNVSVLLQAVGQLIAQILSQDDLAASFLLSSLFGSFFIDCLDIVSSFADIFVFFICFLFFLLL